ncbi:hypothetical protein EEL49_09440 [Muribaculaceae bacterium Isolate-104 (HZI)]|nr:hypothetical protein EEL49_09440 [Muribaculaceae bacterium Isolate-104 (HZI)]
MLCFNVYPTAKLRRRIGGFMRICTFIKKFFSIIPSPLKKLSGNILHQIAGAALEFTKNML